jgi:hypothetical protein
MGDGDGDGPAPAAPPFALSSRPLLRGDDLRGLLLLLLLLLLSVAALAARLAAFFRAAGGGGGAAPRSPPLAGFAPPAGGGLGPGLVDEPGRSSRTDTPLPLPGAARGLPADLLGLPPAAEPGVPPRLPLPKAKAEAEEALRGLGSLRGERRGGEGGGGGGMLVKSSQVKSSPEVQSSFRVQFPTFPRSGDGTHANSNAPEAASIARKVAAAKSFLLLLGQGSYLWSSLSSARQDLLLLFWCTGKVLVCVWMGTYLEGRFRCCDGRIYIVGYLGAMPPLIVGHGAPAPARRQLFD